MFHRVVPVLTALTLFLILASSDSVARGEKTFESLSGGILEALQSFYPVEATARGIHSYDHRLADFSSKSVKTMVKKLTDYSRQLYKYRNAKLTPDQQVDYRLIRSNVDIALLDLKQIKWHQKSPQLYIDEAVDGIYSLLLSQHAPLSERVYSIIARMKAVPGLFETARKNLKAPPEPYLDLASESLESAMRFYREVAADLMRQFPDRADEILRVSTKAREAMNDFVVFLSDVRPGSETSFAIGKKNFDYMLNHQYFLGFDSDSLLKLGEYCWPRRRMNTAVTRTMWMTTIRMEGIPFLYLIVSVVKIFLTITSGKLSR